MTKVILITGATDGIGYQTALQLVEQGYHVYGGGRSPVKLERLKDHQIVPLALDMTKPETLKAAVQTVLEREDRIDVLINGAGYGSYGAIENVSMEEARRQFEVNLFGLAELVKLVLPGMRAMHAGKIINISSMGGRFTAYFGAWYHATKYALEAFSDALRMEVKDFGIEVVLIEPGAIKTNWGLIEAQHLRDSSRGTVYEQAADKAADILKREYTSKMLSKPKVIADAICKSITSKNPRARYLVGFGAKPLVLMHTILPTKMFDWIIKRIV